MSKPRQKAANKFPQQTLAIVQTLVRCGEKKHHPSIICVGTNTVCYAALSIARQSKYKLITQPTFEVTIYVTLFCHLLSRSLFASAHSQQQPGTKLCPSMLFSEGELNSTFFLGFGKCMRNAWHTIQLSRKHFSACRCKHTAHQNCMNCRVKANYQ